MNGKISALNWKAVDECYKIGANIEVDSIRRSKVVHNG